MTSYLQKARWIVCGVKNRDEIELIEDGAILHQDGVILAIGATTDLIRDHPGAVLNGSDEHIILPGFVNAHHHVGMTPLQLGSPDHALELWFASRLSARGLDPYLDTLYSAFEMIASGVTTVQHIHGWTPGPIDTIFSAANHILTAYRAIGMRASYSYAVRDQNRFIYDTDDNLLAALPSPLSTQMAARLRPQQFPFQDNMTLYDMLVAENTGQALTRIQLAPANLHWCSDYALADIESRSRRDNVPMHMHLLETAYQKEYARRRTGTTAVAHLEKLGLLSPRLTLGHAVWLTEADIEMVAARGVCICHNCSSNFRLRSGIAPLNDMARQNIRVAVGIDEAGINDDRDMLQEIRLILNVHRVPGMDDTPPTSGQVLRMATEHGAATTPFGDQIGRLAPGCFADFVVLNHKRALFPYQDELISITDAIMRRAKPSAVDATIINGVTVYENGKFNQVNRDQILDEISSHFARPRTPAEESSIALSREMQDFVRSFYKGYLDDAGYIPFYNQSARS